MFIRHYTEQLKLTCDLRPAVVEQLLCWRTGSMRLQSDDVVASAARGSHCDRESLWEMPPVRLAMLPRLHLGQRCAVNGPSRSRTRDPQQIDNHISLLSAYWVARRRRRRGGREWGGGIPLPSRLGGLGERRELPQRGPGPAPAENDF